MGGGGDWDVGKNVGGGKNMGKGGDWGVGKNVGVGKDLSWGGDKNIILTLGLGLVLARDEIGAVVNEVRVLPPGGSA